MSPRRNCFAGDLSNRSGAGPPRSEGRRPPSLDLAAMTGAGIYHGSQLSFAYGNAVEDGDAFDLGGRRRG